MKTILWKLSAVASALILAGCGGGSSTTSTSSTPLTSTISGTVPGTLIEAFCTDGSYYFVKSTDNGTAEHPFELEIPNTLSCSLVMTTNEDNNVSRVVTQIGMFTPDTSSTLFKAAKDIDLGYIPLEMDYTQVIDVNGDHVSDNVLSIDINGTSIVIELENPLDNDDDGLVDVYEDDDGDGISNYYDDDDDNDGIYDIYDHDDNDSDGDGIDDDSDVDDDNDGTHDEEDDDDNDNTTANIVLPTLYTADAGRLLGSQCAQCHGTNGVSVNEWDSIAGEDDLLNEIQDDEPIMHAQALGYTSDEIILIGNWLKTLKTND
ncbi:hypothetical protein KJ877_08055 [bacterium]|nr:hypothetical protein [bacterium]MBU1990960.1 hypothetical protein [bacterium]